MSTVLAARAAEFQAAWYFGLLLLVILTLTLIAAAYVLIAARRMWRAGDHGPAAVISGITVLGVTTFLGMYLTAFAGLLSTAGAG